MVKKDKIKTVKRLVGELIELLGVKTKVKVSEDKVNQAIEVQLETDEAGILIGYHGQTLKDLQLVLNVATQRELGEWVRILVNVGDWRERREETLKSLAEAVSQKVKYAGQPQTIPDLSAQERRVIHLFLKEDPDVVTESEGEGRQRRLVIKPKPK